MASMLPQAIPESDAASRNAIDDAGDSTSAAGMISSPKQNPAATNPLVTTEMRAPRRMSAPAPHPPNASAAAKIRNGSAPKSARRGSATPRTL